MAGATSRRTTSAKQAKPTATPAAAKPTAAPAAAKLTAAPAAAKLTGRQAKPIAAQAAVPVASTEPAADERVIAEVGRRGLCVPLGPFRARLGGEPALRKVLNALVVVEKVHAGRPRGMARTTRRAYEIERGKGADCLVIPRIKGPPFLKARTRAGLPLFDEIREAPDALPAPRRIAPARCELATPLYEYQEAAVEYLCGEAGPLGSASVAAHRGVAYLQMDTGYGKSRVGYAVIVRRGEPALVVVPTQSIADQWVDEGGEIYPGLAAAVYHNPPKGSRRASPGPRTHDVVVVIVNTLRDKDPSFLEGYGTVVLDEAHEYHSGCNGRALWLAQTRAVLGLSATPDERPDGLDRYVHLHLGAPLLAREIPGYDTTAVCFRGEARVVLYAGHPAHCETASTPQGAMSAVLTIGNVMADPARLQLVAAEVERLYRLHETAGPEELARLGLGPRPAAAATPAHPAGGLRRHGVFVFAELREALPAIREALARRLGREAVLAPELDMPVSVLRGGVSKGTVDQARAAGAHVVLTTYGYSRRGISLPDMSAIVLATPRRNGTRQVLGRMLRRGSDESIVRQVVDVVDVCTGLRGQAKDRRDVYAEKGYPVSQVEASWRDFPDETSAAPAEAAAAEPADLSAMSLDDLLAAALGEEP